MDEQAVVVEDQAEAQGEEGVTELQSEQLSEVAGGQAIIYND